MKHNQRHLSNFHQASDSPTITDNQLAIADIIVQVGKKRISVNRAEVSKLTGAAATTARSAALLADTGIAAAANEAIIGDDNLQPAVVHKRVGRSKRSNERLSVIDIAQKNDAIGTAHRINFDHYARVYLA